MRRFIIVSTISRVAWLDFCAYSCFWCYVVTASPVTFIVADCHALAATSTNTIIIVIYDHDCWCIYVYNSVLILACSYHRCHVFLCVSILMCTY